MKRTALRISLVYVAVAVVWIFASDWVLFNIVPDRISRQAMSVVKGFGFVAVTGLSLYFLLRAWVIGRQSELMNAAAADADRPLNPRYLLWVFLALSAAILVTSYVVTTRINHMLRAQEFNALNAVSVLKAGEIEAWVGERWADLYVLNTDRGFSDRVLRWLTDGDTTQHEQIVARLEAMRRIYDYESVRLYDMNGRMRVEVGEPHGQNPLLERLVQQAARTGKPQFTDLYRGTGEAGHIHLDFIAPLFADDGDPPTYAGVVVLRTIPEQYLYRRMLEWPLTTTTGESLLVRREADSVLFLTRLRYRPDSALNLRMSATERGLPAARAVQGMAGEFEGRDYRGVPVFSVIQPIHGTSWQLISKVDREEILAPVRRVQLVSAAITLLAILLAGLLAGFGWRQQVREFAMRRRVFEAEKTALARHFGYLSRNTNDIVLLTDDAMKIVEVNERTAEILGYPVNEFIGVPIRQFRSAAAGETAERDYARMVEQGHLLYETELRTADGREFPVEVSAARVEVEDRYYYQFVMRDITERRDNDLKVKAARDFYIRVLNDFPNPVWRAGTDGGCDYFNQAWLSFTGRRLGQELGDGWLEGVHPDDLSRCLEIYRAAFADRRAFMMEYRLRHHDGEYRWIADYGKPIFDDDDAFLGYVGSCYDIHDRRLYEERLGALASELAEQKSRLDTVLATTPDQVYLHDREGRYLLANQAGLAALGMTHENVTGGDQRLLGMSATAMQLFHNHWQQVLSDKMPVQGQMSYNSVDGPRDCAFTISPVFGADGSVTATVTTVTDITEIVHARRRIERLTQMYATLSQCNQAIVRISDTTELFNEICRIIVEYGRFHFAWIGRLNESGNEITPIALSSNGDGSHIADLRLSLAADQPGRDHPAGRAVLKNRPAVLNDLFNEGGNGDWMARAQKAGIVAAASFPVRVQGNIFGTLNVCATERDIFSDDLVALLTEMASDIGFALENYRRAEALQQSESTLRQFFDLKFIGMAITSPKSKRWIHVNQTLCDMLGYSHEELVELTWAELTHPDDLAADVGEFERVMRGDSDGYKMEKRYIRKDGRVMHAMIDVKCIRDDAGRADYFVATIDDISERKEAEKQRREQEERYLRQRNALISLSGGESEEADDLIGAFQRITETDAATLDVARSSIWRINRERNTASCVDLYDRSTGAHSSGTHLDLAAFPAYFAALEELDVIAADDAMNDPRTRELATGYLHPLGITAMLDAPIFLGNRMEGILCREHVGAPRQWTADEKTFAIALTNLVSLTIEVWERKRNEEKLAAATAQFQGLVEQSIAGIFIIVDGHFAYVNPRLAEILGCEPEDLVGRDALENIDEADRETIRASLDSCLSGERESRQIVYLGRRCDGTGIDIGAHINRAVHAGKPAIIGVVQDISEKKRADEQIQEYIQRLERGMLGTIKAVSVMSEMRDPYTYGHEQHVGELAAAIAQEMGLDAEVVKGLQIAGYVHDIGKIVVPAEILAKPTKLTNAEFELIKAHPQQGYEVLKGIEFPWPVAEVALQHHERLDGSGYPQGLKGEEIILEARILAVADVVEAMAAHRPYRPSRGIDEALDEVIRHKSVKYDAAAVDACVRLFREYGYQLKSVL